MDKSANSVMSKTSSVNINELCSMADKAYRNNRWRTGHALALRAAMLGERWAQYMIAFSYDEGKGVRRNYVSAAYWYRRAAKQNYSSAQLNLGILYGNGRGVRKSFKTALRYYRLAAQQGNRNACFNLGLYHSEGRGVKESLRWAKYWYGRAAQKGDREAKRRLRQLNMQAKQG